jgi:hypothetical protein
MSDDPPTGRSNPDVLAALIQSGRTLDDELRSLIARHGADPVKEAAKRLVAKKRGRPAEKDWPLLRQWVEQDVQDWLAERDPFEARSNYLIANGFVAKHPGHSPAATVGRIERKLRERRRFMLFAVAVERTSEGWPLAVHLRACAGLVEEGKPEDWSSLLNHPRGVLARYEERFGDAKPSLSLSDMEERLRQPLPGPEGNTLGSILGLRPLGS